MRRPSTRWRPCARHEPRTTSAFSASAGSREPPGRRHRPALYATRPAVPQHVAAKTWLDAALNDRGVVYLPWESLLAFLRISTDSRPGRRGIPVDDAVAVVRLWLSRPSVVVPQPDARHLHRVTELLRAAGRGGPVVMDAHLAALALQYDATVITFDSDFARFPGLRWVRPGE